MLYLGMHDASPEVQSYAITYLRDIALQDFAEDFNAFDAWHASCREKPLATVIAESVRRFVTEMSSAKAAHERIDFLYRNMTAFQAIPEARQAAIDTGLPRLVEAWAVAAARPNATDEEVELASRALRVLAEVHVDESDLKRIVVPLVDRNVPHEVRSAAAGALARKEFPWTVDLLTEALRKTQEEEHGVHVRGHIWAIAEALAEIGDPRAIPTMIAVIDADNTYDTVYGVGYFGLGKLTDVRYDETHDGAWWREWWHKNKARYPDEIAKMEIPTLKKRAAAGKPRPIAASDVDDVASHDLRIGGDPSKRYFLIGPRESAKPPQNGFALIVVLPGGDGSEAFHRFVKRILQYALTDDYLVAQPVAAPKVTWPTAKLPATGPAFTTEEFVDAVIEDVAIRQPFDAKRVYVLAWSSGGPAAYAISLHSKKVAGSFVAMSVYYPELLPPLHGAKGHAYYIHHSREDTLCPFSMAELAAKQLQANGAAVKLATYEGGHGWRGPVFDEIRAGIEWLEANRPRK